MSEKEYNVSVSNTFEANSPEDAVSQMVFWIEEVARHAGYRWESSDVIAGFLQHETGFVDADRIDITGYYEEADENAIAATLGTEEEE
jgi:hypothetical protein